MNDFDLFLLIALIIAIVWDVTLQMQINVLGRILRELDDLISEAENKTND